MKNRPSDFQILRSTLLLASLCALAVPLAGQAAEAKLVFGTGLSIDGITFTPHAFNMT